MSAERLVAYIDGFNLYYGLRDARLRGSRWLDLHGVCTSLLKPSQQLEFVRYFTTRVRGDPHAARRQSVYIDALLAREGIEIDFGEPPWLSRRFLSLGKRGCGYAYTEDAGCSFD